MTQTGAVSGVMADWISLGVLASRVPRDVVDDAVAVTGKGARRSGGKLPPHVMAYFAMALALFADDDYEEVAARLAGTLQGWGAEWEVPTPGGIAQARQRLGHEPLEEVFAQVAVPVADLDTGGAFLGPWRLMSIDGMERDVPDTAGDRAYSGARGGRDGDSAFPRARVVTVSECASHAAVPAAIGPASGGKGTGEETLARTLYPRPEEGWLLIADRNFCNWNDWLTAAGTGAELLWRAKADLRLPVVEMLPDGSCLSVLIWPKATVMQREAVIEAARRGDDLDPARARIVRVIEYDVPDRAGDDELIALITTITDRRQAPAAVLARAYHQRWEHETGNAQLKTCLRGPGRVLRPQSPDMAKQEIWGCLLAHYAISALICEAATAAGIDPDRVKFTRTLRIIRRAAGPALPPGRARAVLAIVMADITTRKNLNPDRRHRTCPRVIKRGRHNSYRIKKPADHGTRHHGPPTIRLANPVNPQLAA